jgi:hypothetical protein
VINRNLRDRVDRGRASCLEAAIVLARYVLILS